MTDDPGQSDPLLGFTRGDATRARALRAQLGVLREATSDPEFRALVDDVLAGRRGLRDAVRAPAFDAAITPRVEQFGTWWDEKSEDERRELAEQGRAAVEDDRGSAE